MKTKKQNKNGQTSIEMTIACVAILVMILETLIGMKGLPLFMN